MNLCNKQYKQPKADREDTRSSARRYGSELATWPVYERLSTSYLDMAVSHLALFFTVNGNKLFFVACAFLPFSVSPILGDRSPVMLNSFIVVSVLKMKVFCCYERAFNAALHHEEQRANVSYLLAQILFAKCPGRDPFILRLLV